MWIFNLFFINITLYLFILITYSNCSDNININTKKINPGFNKDIWVNDTLYLYYIDIQDYYTGEENAVEFVIGYINVLIKSKIYLLTIDQNEEYIFNNYIEFNEEDPGKSKNIRKSATSDLYLYTDIFRKTSDNQTYHLILIETFGIYRNISVQIGLSNRIKNFTITKDDFNASNIVTRVLEVQNNVEDFFKFIIEDISVEEQNLLFFIKDFNIASYYKNELVISQFKGNRLFLIEKKSTNKTTHIVYVGLIGEVGQTTLEISLVKNNIITLTVEGRNYLPFYIENINYNEDLYIIENYDKFNITIIEYNITFIPLYGKSTLTFYNAYNTTDFEKLFAKQKGITIDKKITTISGTSNIFRLSCTSPCALKFGYIHFKNKNSILNEGESITKYIIKNNKIELELNIDDEKKQYALFYELYGDEEIINNSTVSTIISTEQTQKILNKNTRSSSNIIYYNYNKNEKTKISFISYENDVFIKVYLTSDLLYKNIIEGINKIDILSRNLAFKMRKDILYDYLLIDIYSHNKSNKISVFYDAVILSPDKITQNGKVLCELPTTGQYNLKEINLRYSNPYHKYNNRIKDDELMYIIFYIMTSLDDAFPIYFNIKYIYNNIIKIPQKEPKMININEEYKLLGNENYITNNYLILNINKCNQNKNYLIDIYYENKNNIILENNIIDKRNIIFHNNIYDNTSIQLKELIEKNNSNSSIIETNSIIPCDYLINDDIYMNYFTINNSLLYSSKITKDFTIKYEDKKGSVIFNWSPYISKSINLPELTIEYNLYILPIYSKINSICQMSLIPPNYTVINHNNYTAEIPKGEYKVSMIVTVLNEEFPMVTFYDILEINVSEKLSIIIYIVLACSFLIFIIFFIIFFFLKKKKKEGKIDINIINKLNISMIPIDRITN